MTQTTTQEENADELAAAAGNLLQSPEDYHEEEHGHSLVERMDLFLVGFVGVCIALSWSQV